jgi:DNA polymerase III gamma/tau subunit
MAKNVKRNGNTFSVENRMTGKMERYRLMDGKFYRIKSDNTIAKNPIGPTAVRGVLMRELKTGDSPLATRSQPATQRLNPAMKKSKERMTAMRKDANMMSPKPKAVPVPKKKPAETKGRIKKEEFSALMSDALKPKGKVDQSKKRPPKQETKPTSTKPRVRTQKAKNITAGPNTGFGPKGNIFPSNAAERRALMAKFGGTGSAAAKAAAAGKQGNLKKDKK